MSQICVYAIVAMGIALMVGIVSLCILFQVKRSLDSFTSTADQLKKFSKNMEALFSVEKKERRGK